ncbi:MAG: HAD family hydrolase [Desulfobacterales bacterium]|jgi:phosphoglycolate phosphatase-like HAD superfamily hydrolase
MDLKKIKVCIFDVNGVLIDSNPANAKAMGKAFSDDPIMQNRIAEFYLTLTGIDRGSKIRKVQAHFFGAPLTENEFELCWQKLIDLTRQSMTEAPLTKGCADILAALGRLKITRVALSNTPLVELNEILRVQRLDLLLDIIRGGGDWPKIESLARFLDEFQLDPATCVLIGDGKGDLSAARYTKVPFVAIDPDTGEFEGEDGLEGPYKNLAEWGEKQLGKIQGFD